MRVVQALQWLQPTLSQDSAAVKKRLAAIFADQNHGTAIAADLKQGLAAMPVWMQNFLRDLLNGGGGGGGGGGGQHHQQPAQQHHAAEVAAGDDDDHHDGGGDRHKRRGDN
jgi:hypothetical protein